VTRGAAKPRRAGLVALLAAVVVAALAVGPTPADARASCRSAYGYARTWNAALRLLRVDNGWKVTEKDEVSGYLLFEYTSPENPKPTSASLELIRESDHDGTVEVVVQIAQMPRYHEQMLVDALTSKMRKEYGDPPIQPHRDPSEGPVDAGDLADSD
jgi:hypothetical protein